MNQRIEVAEGDVAFAREALDLIAHLSVCCGIVISDGHGNTMAGHAMYPESHVSDYNARHLGGYITPRLSIEAILRSLGEKGIEASTLKAYIFGCNISDIAADTAEEAKRVLEEHGIPIASDMTQQGHIIRHYGLRLRIAPAKIKVDFLGSTEPQAEIDLS